MYDAFTDANLGVDATKWRESEYLRFIDDKGRLTLGRWTYGSNTSDTGTTAESFSTSATDNAPAKILKVTVVALDVGANGCASQHHAFERGGPHHRRLLQHPSGRPGERAT